MSFLLDFFLGPISKPKEKQQEHTQTQQTVQAGGDGAPAAPTGAAVAAPFAGSFAVPALAAAASSVAAPSASSSPDQPATLAKDGAPHAAAAAAASSSTPPNPPPSLHVAAAASKPTHTPANNATAAASSSSASAASSSAAAAAPSVAAAAVSVSPTQKEEEEAWTTLLRIRECFVYGVPARVGLNAYQAESWGLDKPIFTGELHVVGRAHTLQLRLQEPGSMSGSGLGGALFACSVDLDMLQAGVSIPLEAFLEPVRDSSRYFVIRVRSPQTGQVASLGIGFRERSSAFDLNAALQDRARSVQRHAQLEEGLAAEMALLGGGSETAQGSAAGSSGAAAALSREEADRLEIAAAEQRLARGRVDLALKEGQRIHVPLKDKHLPAAPGGPGRGGEGAGRRAVAAAAAKANKLASMPVSFIGEEGSTGFRLAPPPEAAAAAAADVDDLEHEAPQHDANDDYDAPQPHTLPPAPTTLSPGHSPVHRPVGAEQQQQQQPPQLQLDESHAEGQPAAAAAHVSPTPNDDEFTEFASAH